MQALLSFVCCESHARPARCCSFPAPTPCLTGAWQCCAAPPLLLYSTVMVEIYITRLVIRFYKILRTFSEDDLLLLRTMDHVPVQMVYW